MCVSCRNNSYLLSPFLSRGVQSSYGSATTKANCQAQVRTSDLKHDPAWFMLKSPP
jgi:hypothetical protein